MDNRLAQIRCFLLDMDGTFYLGESLLPGALEFLDYLRAKGIDFLFLTNNSSKSRWDYQQKLARLGVDLPPEAIFTSGEATTIYLNQQKPAARIYLVGTPALEEEFEHADFILTEQNPDYVVLGFDTTLTYQKVWTLCDLVKAGVPYIATHPDINCPTETGFMPDIGAMMEMIAASSGHRPDVVIGKPNATILEALAAKIHLPVEQICMVGDRLYTDIALGASGCQTVLVLSGETQLEDIPAAPVKPDWIMSDLAHLLDSLRTAHQP